MRQPCRVVSFRSSFESFVPTARASLHCLPHWMSFHVRVLQTSILSILSVIMQFLVEHWGRYLISPCVEFRYYDPQVFDLLGHLLSLFVGSVQMVKEHYFLRLLYTSEESYCSLHCWRAPWFFQFLRCLALYPLHEFWLPLSPFVLCLAAGWVWILSLLQFHPQFLHFGTVAWLTLLQAFIGHLRISPAGSFCQSYPISRHFFPPCSYLAFLRFPFLTSTIS